MTQQELLLALQDISPPTEPPWWLPGNGQLALLLLVIVLAFMIWQIRRRRQRRRGVVLAQRELASIRREFEQNADAGRLARKLSAWLKKVAIAAFPEQPIAASCGREWLRFLDASMGDEAFTRGCGQVFGDAVYRQNPSVDGARLIQLCEQWLLRVQPRLLRGGQT